MYFMTAFILPNSCTQIGLRAIRANYIYKTNTYISGPIMGLQGSQESQEDNVVLYRTIHNPYTGCYVT